MILKFNMMYLLCISLLVSLCSTEEYIRKSFNPLDTTTTVITSNSKDKSKLSHDQLMLNDSPMSNGYSLLRTDVIRQHLHVWRGHSSPLLHEHLPILPRAQKGQVCHVEVEEFQPLLSMVGHLEPKKFDCSFANGDVIYRHEGNPLINHDHVQVTIFFFRNNNSVVQTVDIMIDIEDPWIYSIQDHYNNTIHQMNNTIQELHKNDNKKYEIKQNYPIHSIPQSRIEVLKELTVKNLRATSESISSDILRIRYDLDKEECRLRYVSPDYLIIRGQLTNTSDWTTLTRLGGTQTPKLGMPLTAGSAVGGVRRWPLFGQIVHFNRTMVDYIDRDCQEALLQGYRYLHRKGNSYVTDYIPIQITTWRRMSDGSRGHLVTESKFLKVTISNAQNLKPPVLRAFRQVNVTHIGGSLSILPRDSISIPRNSIPGWEYLDINMTRMQGPLQAQVVNLRDPTRPVTSFRLSDLRQGLIALQLLNYAESLVKVFVITMTAIDPYFQTSQPVNLRIATFLQPVVEINSFKSTSNAQPSFQVFSLPLFTYTGAISLIQKHNIQVVGYIDESMIVYTIRSLLNEDINIHTNSSTNQSKGYLLLDGQSAYNVNFGPPHISSMSLAYVHNGEYEPTVERIPLSITMPSLMNSYLRKKRNEQFLQNSTVDYSYHHYRKRRHYSTLNDEHSKQRKNRRTIHNSNVQQLELSIRIVRLHNYINNGALKSSNTFHLSTLSSICFTANDLLTNQALNAIHNDLINLAFVIKVAPSQGVLIHLSMLKNFTISHYLHRNYQINHSNYYNNQLYTEYTTYNDNMNNNNNNNNDMVIMEQKIDELIEKSQISVIHLSDLENGEICYLNQRYDRNTDLIGIKQIGRVDFPTVYMTFVLQPPIPIIIVERMDPNVILRVRETASYVPLTSLHLNYGMEWNIPSNSFEQYNQSMFDNLGTENIIYTILQAPRLKQLGDTTGIQKTAYIGTHDAGRLVSLSSITSSTHVGDMKLQAGLAINLREAYVPCVMQFTQRQIDENDIVYVPPTQDIGYTDQDLIVRYSVSGPGGYELNNREMRIQLVAEDNQTPEVKIISPLRLHRDGELCIDSSILSITDLDTPEDKLLIQFESLPKYGKIILNILSSSSSSSNHQSKSSNQLQEIPINKHQNISFTSFKQRQLIYQQSGDNVKQDDFILTITDGIQTSTPLKVLIEIKPRILQENKWHQLVNNTILVKENSSVILTSSIFPMNTMNDSNDNMELVSMPMTTIDTPQYFVIVFPTKGNLLMNNKHKVSQFTNKDILENRLTYHHGPAEIGVKPAYDFIRIWNFNTGETFSLNFTLIPVNSQPPILKTETILQVKEGDKVEITPYALYAFDVDTNENDIQLHIIHPPKWGHIELINKFNSTQQQQQQQHPQQQQEQQQTHSLINEYDNIQSILSFTMQNIRDNLVYYINSIHQNGQESILDVFSVKAYDGKYYSPTIIEIKLIIQPINDEIPNIRLLKYFSVSMNTRKVLTPYLFKVNDMDVPRDMLQITFNKLPKYGNLCIYWQHGEKYPITSLNNIITESYLGMLNLLYIQNASYIDTMKSPYSLTTIIIDQFNVIVNDGKHIVEQQANVLIRRLNQYSPIMYIDNETLDGIILDGQKWTQLNRMPGGLIIHDVDTSDDDLILTLLEKPKYGIIQRLPHLIEEAWDIEEMKAGDDLQALAELSIAGSIGGPKTIKTLDRGDLFTKRQITTGRIHYVYTSSYQEHYITDSCVIRLTDGQYTTDPITLRFRIRRVDGINGGLAQSSLPYLPITNLQPLRPLEYPETKSSNYIDHQNDASDINSDSINPIYLLATINSFTFIQYKHIQCNKTMNKSFTLIFQSNYHSSSTSCGYLAHTINPLKYITQFTDNDVKMHQIVFSAYNCEQFLNKTIQFNVKLITSSSNHDDEADEDHYYLGETLLIITFIKKQINLPEFINQSNLLILPYTNNFIKTKHLLLNDKDTNPNQLIYIVTKLYNQQFNQYYDQLININNETLNCFTQSQINSQQIFYSSYTHNITSLLLYLHIFDANDLGYINNLKELCYNILLILNSVDKINQQKNPYLERMFYVVKVNNTKIKIVNEPIQLKIEYRMLTNSNNNSNELLINEPPKSDSLETVLTGYTGFYLTSDHIYMLNPWTKYKLLRNHHHNMNCQLFNKIENKSITDYFYQNDLNRRKLVVIIGLKNKRKMRNLQKKQFIDTFCEIHYEVISTNNHNNNTNQVKRYSMELNWIKLGFNHKVYTICSIKGILTLTVIRKGTNKTIQSTLTDVYIGLSSDTAIEGKDFSLHSQKLVVFQKDVSIRFHPTARNLNQKNLRFYVDLKLPTGAILDRKRRAEVIVQIKRDVTGVIHSNLNDFNGDNQSYLSDIQTIPNNNDKDYLRDSIKSSDSLKSHISLTEWLAINDLPDSKALSASYENYMHMNKHIMQCLNGWKFYQHRCYRLYENKEITWEEARNYCELQDGFLTSITDETNLKWLVETFHIRHPFWIGISNEYIHEFL
ncbi:fras1 related extracellular matrix protein [Schistosoma japonicum]|nr:fras1 related extracellular matrix protein [Schistosoma japonicum]